MDNVTAVLADQFSRLSGLEVAAVVLAIGYLVLAIRQNIGCWVCAGISAAIYVALFAQASLYMESLLNAFYFGMAVYGWRVWSSDSGGLDELPVSRWPRDTHLFALAVIGALSLSTGYLLDRYTDAAFPYADSMTTYASVWATFLVAKKVLENWWYWLAIDCVSIVIYWSRHLELTSALYVLYVILIPFGLAVWTRSYRNARQLVATA